jgi:hypothetical protein
LMRRASSSGNAAKGPSAARAGARAEQTGVTLERLPTNHDYRAAGHCARHRRHRTRQEQRRAEMSSSGSAPAAQRRRLSSDRPSVDLVRRAASAPGG